MQRVICCGMLRASLCIFFSWKYKAKRPARAYRQIIRLHVTQLFWNSSSHTPRSASDVSSGVRAKRFAKLVNNIACFPSTSTTLFLKQSDNWSRCIKCTLLSPSKCNTTSCAKLTPFATTGSTILSRDIPFISLLQWMKGVFKLISAIALSRSQPILDLYPASPITVFLNQRNEILSLHTNHVKITIATTSCNFLCFRSYILEPKLLSVAWKTLRAQIKTGRIGNSGLWHSRPQRTVIYEDWHVDISITQSPVCFCQCTRENKYWTQVLQRKLLHI